MVDFVIKPVVSSNIHYFELFDRLKSNTTQREFYRFFKPAFVRNFFFIYQYILKISLLYNLTRICLDFTIFQYSLIDALFKPAFLIYQ
jgi:hypothetical protein